MADFSLIKDIDSGKNKRIDPEIARIRYHRFDMKVDGKDMPVEIPVREAIKFQEFLEDNKNIKEDAVRGILRHFRGIKVRDGEE